MLIAERKTRLRELLSRRGMSDLDSLAAELRVSQSTVRRDIDEMESRGLVQRDARRRDLGRRGAQRRPRHAPYAFDQRMGYELAAKEQIAKAAAKLVQPGETILLDGGTTTFYLAEQLVGLPLQIVTNSLPIANLFLNDENVELVLTGGLMYPRYGVLLGPGAESAISTIHAKTMFFSVAGVHDGLLYNQNLLLVQAELKMMKQVQRKVLLVDSEVRPAGVGAIVQPRRDRRRRHRLRDRESPPEAHPRGGLRAHYRGLNGTGPSAGARAACSRVLMKSSYFVAR
jgi:DeoR/GlpR family transcriptional regulator of sugar metabolism